MLLLHISCRCEAFNRVEPVFIVYCFYARSVGGTTQLVQLGKTRGAMTSLLAISNPPLSIPWMAERIVRRTVCTLPGALTALDGASSAEIVAECAVEKPAKTDVGCARVTGTLALDARMREHVTSTRLPRKRGVEFAST